ncbi:MAG: type II toxin-antitoxin system HigB family toxin [Saprospiraceae bacterium]
MKVLVKKTILYYVKKYPKARTQLLVWYSDFSKLKLANFNELKSIYGSVSIVGNFRVVFNIKGNDFRLLVAINFDLLACYIIWFGTHKEYDQINVESISYDPRILNE